MVAAPAWRVWQAGGIHRPALSPLTSRPLITGPGLQPLLDSTDFEAWEQLVGGALGHHRSRLLPGSIPFAARIQGASLEEFRLLLVQGRGQVELMREQCGHGVLWLPLQGWSHEVINGEEHLAEEGMGLLFRPGDVMRGVTSELVTGVSILLPASILPVSSMPTPLLHQGSTARRLIDAAWQLVESAARPVSSARFAAEALVDAMQQWGDAACRDATPERVTAVRRRCTVVDASLWMQEHLAERFSVNTLSQVLHVSVRTLQYSFQAELGCTPMGHAKRLRLRRLRQLLQDPERAAWSIAELMAASGLLACGATAADYRQWCGESPRQTRFRSLAP